MKIAVIGMGYVGLSNAVLLSQKHEVVTFDLDKYKVARLNNKISPIVDSELENYLQNKSLHLSSLSS